MSASLIGQVEWLYEQNRGIGESRRAWRDRNPGFGKMAPKTFSWEAEHRYKQVACQFVRWAAERHAVKRIRDIRPEMVEDYIAERRAAGRSPRTLATEITALRRLGMYAAAAKWVESNFVPDDLSNPHGSNPRYSYTPAHAEAIIRHVEQVNPRAADVLRFQLSAGLRLSEAVMLRIDEVDLAGGTVTVKGKGGRIRTVKLLDATVLERLEMSQRFPLLRGLKHNWMREVEELVASACKVLDIKPLGTHGFRATAAQKLYDELLSAGTGEREARRRVARFLGHNRTDVTHHYVP